MYMYVMDICRNISVEAPWGQELSDIFSYRTVFSIYCTQSD